MVTLSFGSTFLWLVLAEYNCIELHDRWQTARFD
jgi:hypothetical protein